MFLKVVRSIKADKQNSIIQIIGLVIGIVTCLFIGRYAFFEYSFDDFHKEKELIYRTQGTESMLIGPLAKDNLSYVEDYTRVHPCYRGVSVNAADKVFHENKLYFADSSFFKVFSYQVLYGDAIKTLALKNHMAISESYAKKYFGDENPIGKTLLLNSTFESNISYTIGTVFKDFPANSHLQTDMLLSLENILVNDMYTKESPWEWSNYFTYFKTNRTIRKLLLEEDLRELAIANGATEYFTKPVSYSICALTDLHLNGQINYMDNNRDKRYVNIRIIIGLIILAMAWLNFINISIGSTLRRKLELGVKKSLGASSVKLWSELFQKTLVLNLIALFFAIILYLFISALFKESSFNQFELPNITLLKFFSSIVFLLLIGSFLVSFLIHSLLNRHKTISLLSKSDNKEKGLISPWVVLFVMQFSTSIVLIAFAIFSIKQVNDLMRVDTGMKTDEILAIRSADYAPIGGLKSARSAFEEEVLNIPGVTLATSSTYIPGSKIPSCMPTRLSTKTRDENIDCRMNFVGYNYIAMFKHHLLTGRNFSEEHSTDKSGVIINETLARAYGFTNVSEALGQEIFWDSRKKYKTIIGVVSDFHQQFADITVEPALFMLWKHARGYCLVNIEASNTKAVIDTIEKLWNRIHPGNSFDYLWIDEKYNQQFEKWIDYSQLIKVFSLLAILIACIGLFGLTSMLLAKRTKEIGMRKVIGAKNLEIVILLNKGFTKWVGVAFIIAIPIAWYTINRWLENFAYKTAICWWVFALAGLMALAIALIAVSWQTWRAASRNPVESLRYE